MKEESLVVSLRLGNVETAAYIMIVVGISPLPGAFQLAPALADRLITSRLSWLLT